MAKVQMTSQRTIDAKEAIDAKVQALYTRSSQLLCMLCIGWLLCSAHPQTFSSLNSHVAIDCQLIAINLFLELSTT